MDEKYHDLSLRLYQILDWVGASEEMRGKYREHAVVQETLSTAFFHFFDGKSTAIYVFGSSSEGTTTMGLDSDRDTLTCNYIPVVENIADAARRGLSHLIVTDETTKPGYCKLQVVIDGVPLRQVVIYDQYGSIHEEFESDQHHRICVRHINRCDDDFPDQNGPAVTRSGVIGEADIDQVFAFECKKVPSIARSWLERVTSCKRLNKEQKETLKVSGCFLVGINHPSSQNGPIEWRLSFSIQERELMASLNPTQHKCYVLLKMIKKDIIHKEVPRSVSSYHLKTCLLYAVENTRMEFWTHGNFLECVFHCIKLLLRWVTEGFCPNYFIPEENMFDRLENTTLQRVQIVLGNMVEHWCGFLWSLTCDDIGTVLKDVMFGDGVDILRSRHWNVMKGSLLVYRSICGSIGRCAQLCMEQCANRSSFQSLKTLYGFHRYVQQMKCAPDSSKEETRMAFRYFSPHISLSITQYIISLMVSTQHAEPLRILACMANHYIRESKESGVISVDLIVASYNLNKKRYETCESILYECETFLKSHVTSLCSCSTRQPFYESPAVNELTRMFRSGDFLYRDFVRTSTAGCLSFPPNQANLVPAALHCEMYRSVNTPAGSRNERKDWMVVDSIVYLYFLQYLLFSETNKPVCKQDAIDNLVHVIENYPNLGHKEIAWNILGWIHKRENQPGLAIKCFLNSWRIRPNHNAAKWHMLEMILKLGRS